MFPHIVLGLLRDGSSRHGYRLVKDYRTLSGAKANTGNLYRGLAKLRSQGLIEAHATDPGADARQIPYRITRDGQEEFDAWLLAPSLHDYDLETWLLFVTLLAAPDRRRLIEKLQDEVWMESKVVERAREGAAARARRAGTVGCQPAQILLLRRAKLLTAHFELLEALSAELECTAPGFVTSVSSGAKTPIAPRSLQEQPSRRDRLRTRG